MVHPSQAHAEAQDSPRLIAGRYRIDAPLAEGGMALVFQGWHVLLEQPIAIKILKDEYCKLPEAVARFLREARATAQLQGRHVAHVFDIGKVEGRTPFMVTELLKGSDLGKLLRAEEFSVARAVATLVAVCDAVLEVHAAGIVHRDLKPDNLFLVLGTGDPHVKILDFGVAKPLHTGPSLTLPERGVGSPHYMSPEQIMTPLDVDFRSDVWSLGVVFLELLKRGTPFAGVTITDLCTSIIRSDVSPPSGFRAMPAALEQIIFKCLEKDRADRFQNVAELREALLGVHQAFTTEERPFGRIRGMLMLLGASLVPFALTFAGVVYLLDTASTYAPIANPERPVGRQPPGNAPKSSAVPSIPSAPLVTAVLCDTGELPGANALASGIDGCRTDAPDAAQLLQGAARREQSAHVPPRVQLRGAVPEPLEPWLWLDRDARVSRVPDLPDDEVIDPYADGPHTPR